MAKMLGKDGMVKIGDSLTSVVAALNEWSLTSNADRIEVTSFGATDKEYLAGFKESTLRFSGFYDDADTFQGDLHEAFADGSEVHVALFTDTDSGFQGSGVVVSREVTTGVAGAVTCTFEIAVNGAVIPFAGTPATP